ncbi:MAG: hypothetical protein GWO04_02590, partial [Actinobacteria bacterium]|nr:hypothetical protein [Actinomycetota bacterium]
MTGNVRTLNGDVSLDRSARVGGDVIIADRGNSSPRKRPLRIELEGGSVIEGSVVNEDPSTDVEL